MMNNIIENIQISNIIVLIIQITILTIAIYNTYINIEILDKSNISIKRNTKYTYYIISIIISIFISIYMKLTIVQTISLICIVFLLPKAKDYFDIKASKKILSEYYSEIFFLFEIGIKSNIDIGEILDIISKSTIGSISKIFNQALIIYRNTYNKIEAMDYINKSFKTPEIDVLKQTIVQTERIGEQGIKSLETLTEVTLNNKVVQLTRKKELIQYATVISCFLILLGILLVIIVPSFNEINNAIREVF